MDALVFFIAIYALSVAVVGLILFFRHIGVSKQALEAKEYLGKLQLKVNEAKGLLHKRATIDTENEEEEEPGFDLGSAITPESIAQWLTMDSGAIVDYFYKNKTIPSIVPRQAAVGFVEKLKEQLKSGAGKAPSALPSINERFM